jgi:hypothetical protein
LLTRQTFSGKFWITEVDAKHARCGPANLANVAKHVGAFFKQIFQGHEWLRLCSQNPNFHM